MHFIASLVAKSLHVGLGALLLWWGCDWIASGSLGPRAYVLIFGLVAISSALPPTDNRARDRRFRTGWKNNEVAPEGEPGAGAALLLGASALVLWWYWNDLSQSIGTKKQELELWVNATATPFLRSYFWIALVAPIFLGPIQGILWERRLGFTDVKDGQPAAPKELGEFLPAELARIETFRKSFVERGLEWKVATDEALEVEVRAPIRRTRDGSVDLRQRNSWKVARAERLSDELDEFVNTVRTELQDIRASAMTRLEQWKDKAQTVALLRYLGRVSLLAGCVALAVFFWLRADPNSYALRAVWVSAVAFSLLFAAGALVANILARSKVTEVTREAEAQLHANAVNMRQPERTITEAIAVSSE